MILKKKGETFDVYSLEVSYKELQAIQAACSECGDPIGDEVARGLDWYFANIVPPPGMEEHPSKAKTADELLPDAGGDGDAGPIDGGGAPGAEPALGSPEVGAEMGAPDDGGELPPADDEPIGGGAPAPDAAPAPGTPPEEEEVDTLLPKA
jgi:hypothetical protein